MTTFEEGNYDDINAWRNGYKWSINECLQLEREYDLLKMSVPDMALKHNRTINAIMFKLEAEGLDTYNNLYVKTFGQNYIDDQIEKLNNLCSTEECDDDFSEDEKDEDEDNDDDYHPNLDESDDDEEEENQEEDNLDDGSNKTYVFNQIKRIHMHINNLLNYFTNSNANSKTNTKSSKEEEIIF
jgi:hypothetical protein